MSPDRAPEADRDLAGNDRQAAATRGRRKLLFALLALLLAIASGLAWLFSADHSYLRDDIESWVSNSLGREVRIHGPMHLRLGSVIHFSVDKLVVASRDWTKEPALLQLDELTASLSLTSLFSREIRIETMSLSGLKIYLEVDPDNGNNWSLGHTEEVASTPEIRKQRPRIPFRIERFELANSILEFRSPALTEVLQFSITRLTESILTDRQVEITLHGDVNDTPVDLAVRINDIERLNALQDVRLTTDGSLGEIRLSGKLEFEDLLQPSRPLADIGLDGPDIAYLAEILRIESVTSGPLALKFKIEPADDNMSVNLDARFGEFVIGAEGYFDDLQSLHAGQLAFDAKGPNVRKVGAALGLANLPAVPFIASGTLQKKADLVEFRDTRLVLGESTLLASARFPGFPSTRAAQASIRLEGKQLETFAGVTGLDAGFKGAFKAALDLRAGNEDKTEIEIHASFSDLELAASGHVVDTPGYQGSELKLELIAADLSRLRHVAGFDELPAQAYTLHADVRRERNSVSVANGKLSSGNDFLLFAGVIADQLLDAGTAIDFELQLANARQTVNSFGIAAENLPTQALHASGKLQAHKQILHLQNVRGQVAEAEFTLDGSVANLQSAPTAQLDVAVSGPDISQLMGVRSTDSRLIMPYRFSATVEIESVEFRASNAELRIGETTIRGAMTSRRPEVFKNPDLKLEVTSPDLFALLAGLGRPDGPANVPLSAKLDASVSDDAVLLKDLHAVSNGARLVASGKVRLDRHLVGSDLQLEFTALDTTLIAALSAIDMPDDSIATTFHLRSVANGLRIDDLSLRLGTNRVRGRFALDSGDIPDIGIDLSADVLDISHYTADAPTKTVRKPVAPNARLIPEFDIPVQWLERGNLEFSLRIGKLVNRLREVSSIELSGNVQNGELNVRNFHLVGAQGGDLSGRMRIRPHTAGTELGIQLQGKNVELGLPAKTPAEQEQLPRFTVDAIVRAYGKTTREMAGNLNGYIKLVGGAGKMRGGTIKAISSDFVSELVDTVNPFLKKDPFLNLQCAVLLATMQNGQLSGSPVLAMQSDRLNVTAKTKIDLKTEVIDADINTVAQQGLGFSLNDLLNPYIKIKGTLANPSLALDKGNALVQGGAAVATAGISILAKNLSDRFLSSSEICQKMLDRSQAQFEALARQYANTVADK